MTATVDQTALPLDVPARVLGYFEPGSEEWHAARRDGVGGSEIAAVMGLSPYESRFSLWHRKQGLVSPVEESEEMYWGKVHEPGICARFAKEHPEFRVELSPTFVSGDRPWQIVNPDRLLWGPDGLELLEAKTSRDDALWGEPFSDVLPVWYRAQCLWYLDALRATRCRLAVLIAGSEYREYVIDYDEADCLKMRAAAAEFMRTIRDGERPAIDGHTATYQVIRELPEGLEDVDVDITPQLRDRFHAAQDRFWAAEDELTACRGELLDAIGTGRRAVVGDERVATRTVREGRTYQLLPARTRRTAA
jgi:putative phage-type endonuclease